MTAKALNRCNLVLSFAGIFISGYLSLGELLHREVACGAAASCAKVAADPSSHPFGPGGPSNANLGFFGYLFLAILACAQLFTPVATGKKLVVVGYLISAVGFIYSAYLTYVSFAQIHATCVWCLSSALTITLLLATNAMLFQAEPKADEHPRSSMLDLGLVAVMPFAVMMGLAAMGFSLAKARPVFTMPKLSPKKYPLLAEGRHRFGLSDAPITIVEFADLMCIHCREEFPKVRSIVLHSGGKIQLVFRHLPLYKNPEHRMSLPAAMMAEMADEKGKFFDFVYDYYRAELPPTATFNDALAIAKTEGLDPEAVRKRCAEAKETDPAFQRVQLDIDTAAAWGVDTTPTYFIMAKGLPTIGAVGDELEDKLRAPAYQQILKGQ